MLYIVPVFVYMFNVTSVFPNNYFNRAAIHTPKAASDFQRATWAGFEPVTSRVLDGCSVVYIVHVISYCVCMYTCTCSVQCTVYAVYNVLYVCVYLSTGVVHAADNSDCPLPDLLSGVPSIDEQLEIPLIPACIPSEQTNGLCVFEFLEGSVSYTDNTTNSIAFYNVSEAYCINSTMERKCEAGKWLDDVIFQEG